jgi:DNA-binding winged helix-turn-helix (wHTH) protein
MVASQPVKYTFGRVCVDAGARSISNAAGAVHLTRKAFDLLLLLLERRPHAVSKQVIQASLWPDTFVAEASLQTLIHEIRQAIDDREAPASWIDTVRGIGYRFAGHVLVHDARSPASPRSARPAAWLIGDSIRIPLHAGENIVGRLLDTPVPEVATGIIEIDAPTISRRHARITVGDVVTLEDLGSKNGTWLRNERLTAPGALADGDVVSLGSARFTFRLARSRRSTETVDGRR